MQQRPFDRAGSRRPLLLFQHEHLASRAVFPATRGRTHPSTIAFVLSTSSERTIELAMIGWPALIGSPDSYGSPEES